MVMWTKRMEKNALVPSMFLGIERLLGFEKSYELAVKSKPVLNDGSVSNQAVTEAQQVPPPFHKRLVQQCQKQIDASEKLMTNLSKDFPEKMKRLV